MLRKIIVLSLFAGLIITTLTGNIKLEGLRWFMPDRAVCGNHWGGLPFTYNYQYLKSKAVPTDTVLLCMGASRTTPMIIDWFIWSFVVYVGTEAYLKIMKQRRPHL